MKIIKTITSTSAIAIISITNSACVPQDTQQAVANSSENNTLEVRTFISESAVLSPCEVSEEQVAMLQLVNEARAQERKCGDETYPAVGPVTWNCKLAEAAMNHTVDMVDNNFFAHDGSDGLNAGNRIDAVGYNWRTYGENLAAGFDDPKKAVDALLASPGHCVNIMGAGFKEFGSAAIFNSGAYYKHYWTQEYGTQL